MHKLNLNSLLLLYFNKNIHNVLYDNGALNACYFFNQFRFILVVHDSAQRNSMQLYMNTIQWVHKIELTLILYILIYELDMLIILRGR